MAYYIMQCPSCGATNWVNNGDESDLTRPDVDVIICYNCGGRSDLDGNPDEEDGLSSWEEEGKPDPFQRVKELKEEIRAFEEYFVGRPLPIQVEKLRGKK